MTDRNAKPFTLFIFGMMFVLMVISQIIIKNRYELLLDHEMQDFTDTYISYTEMIDQKVCYYLKTYFAFENAPDSAYQQLLDATASSIKEIESAYIYTNDGKILWSSIKDKNLDLSIDKMKEIAKDTNDTTEICKHYEDGCVYYSKRLFAGDKQVGIVCLKVSYDQIVNMLDDVYDKFSWLNVIIKDKYNNIIYQSNNRLEKEVKSNVELLFENSDKSINEGNEDIIFKTKTRQNKSNKEMIGHYKPNLGFGSIEREIVRRDKLIEQTSTGENLQLSITAASSLKELDPNYYSRFIIMIFLLALILICHLIAGFFIPDKSMFTEFKICLILFVVIYFIHFTLEVGFLHNIYENELEYYERIVSKINEYDDEWMSSFTETVGQALTAQDFFMDGPGYNTGIINQVGRQIIVENNLITTIALIENNEIVFQYPEGHDFSIYKDEIKEASNSVIQKTFFDKANNTGIVISKINFKYNPNVKILCEYKVQNAAALASSDKFEMFGFRDAYGDSKLLNLETDEAIDSFVDKVTFDDKVSSETGIKYVDRKLYGYIMIPNSSQNIIVFRYELENLYYFLATLFVIVIMFMILISIFSLKVFNGTVKERKQSSDDAVYEKLLKKIEQDVADYSDDTFD